MLGFMSSNLLVYWTGWTTDLKLFIAMGLGLVLLAVNKAFSRHEAMNRYNMAFRAGFWYIPWLTGLAIISYLGDYDGGDRTAPLRHRRARDYGVLAGNLLDGDSLLVPGQEG